jgi:hypothetical protein
MRPPDALRWDVMVLSFDGHTPLAPASWRPGHGPRPMGSADVVRRAVDDALADVDWSDPAQGLLDAGEPVLVFDLGHAAALDGFVVHVRRRGPPGRAAALIAHMCLVNGWAALDCTTGAYLDLDNPDAWERRAQPAQA